MSRPSDDTPSVLWAPWRMEFVAGRKDDGCVFCALPRAADDRESLVIHRGARAYVALNRYPYGPGHLLVVPFRHLAEPWSLERAERHEIDDLIALGLRVLRDELAPTGFNVGANVGRAAGAGITTHLHHHVVPRWDGDTNFMPVLASVTVVPEHLQKTYDRLRSSFDRARDA